MYKPNPYRRNSPGNSFFSLRKAVSLTAGLMLAAPTYSLADEGMWTADNFPAGTLADKYGTVIDEKFLSGLQKATTRLEGGCTGSFASPAGLILTNHHCVQRCLTQYSSEDNDLRARGFLAANRAKEQRCESEQVSVLVGYEDVTAAVTEATTGLTEAEANRVRKSTLTRLENECKRAAGKNVTICESVSLYQGGQYFIYKYKRYDDVRLVFAPEQAIAAFGGDPDNFNFPRWCLDMALLRAYENGKPAMTPDFLRWKRAGAQKDETVFISGHPGSTQRSLTVAQLRHLRDVRIPEWIERNSEQRGRIIQYGKSGAEAQRIAGETLQSLENGLKVQRNRLAALLNDNMLTLKAAEEDKLRKAVAANPELTDKYGSAWQDDEQAVATYRDFYVRYNYIERSAGFGGILSTYARQLVRAAAEREKSEAERLRAYTDNALIQLKQQVLAARPIHSDLEELRLSFTLDKMREAFGPDDPFVKLILGKRSPDQMAQQLVSATRLGDPEYRRQLWEGGNTAIGESSDPMIRLALAVDPEARQLRKRYDDEVEAPLRVAGEQIAAARFAVFGTGTYPDATFTFRITYGTVKGWDELGENIDPFTTVGQLYPRVTGQAPFSLPERWQEQRVDSAVRFNFAATTDITGGNSGSPMTNASGELVGLAFDGNIHSIAGAYFFDESLNRTVLVHPQLMLAALEELYGADHLAREISGN